MRCRTCGYGFDPVQGLACPRCGEAVDCTAVDCETCGACSGTLGGLLGRLRGTARDGGRTSDDAT